MSAYPLMVRNSMAVKMKDGKKNLTDLENSLTSMDWLPRWVFILEVVFNIHTIQRVIIVTQRFLDGSKT